jgi:hypothetical protein
VNTGRPRKNRVPGSGDKLRRALEILGMTWGKNNATTNHVLRNDRWARCNLPKSVNTIREDMKLGLPADRMAGYASFLNIPMELLRDAGVTCGETAFVQAVSAAREASTALNLPLFTSYNDNFCRQYYAHNQRDYIASLFDLMRGLYTFQTVWPPSDEIHNGCALLHAAEDHFLRATIFMFLHATDIVYEAVLFRWGNNLHISYYSLDMYVLGRLLTMDPLRDFAVSHRKPFYLDFSGVSDAITGPKTFSIIHCRAEQIDRTPEPSLRARFEQACHKVRRRPAISPTDDNHARLLKRILAPE